MWQGRKCLGLWCDKAGRNRNRSEGRAWQSPNSKTIGTRRTAGWQCKAETATKAAQEVADQSCPHVRGRGWHTPPKVTGQVCMPSYLREGPFPPLPGSFFPPHLTANKLDAKAITTTTMFTDNDREQNYYQEVGKFFLFVLGD